MNFVELMEFLRTYSAINSQDAEVKPNLQILYEYKKGYLLFFNQKDCGTGCFSKLERMIAQRRLRLEVQGNYWVAWSPEEP
jgi:hypothetical protein